MPRCRRHQSSSVFPIAQTGLAILVTQALLHPTCPLNWHRELEVERLPEAPFEYSEIWHLHLESKKIVFEIIIFYFAKSLWKAANKSIIDSSTVLNGKLICSLYQLGKGSAAYFWTRISSIHEKSRLYSASLRRSKAHPEISQLSPCLRFSIEFLQMYFLFYNKIILFLAYEHGKNFNVKVTYANGILNFFPEEDLTISAFGFVTWSSSREKKLNFNQCWNDNAKGWSLNPRTSASIIFIEN